MEKKRKEFKSKLADKILSSEDHSRVSKKTGSIERLENKNKLEKIKAKELVKGRKEKSTVNKNSFLETKESDKALERSLEQERREQHKRDYKKLEEMDKDINKATSVIAKGATATILMNEINARLADEYEKEKQSRIFKKNRSDDFELER